MSDDPLSAAVDHAAHEFDKQEEEDARDLVAILFALPDDMQRLYQDVVELHQAGRYADSGAAWAMWMREARERGLL